MELATSEPGRLPRRLNSGHARVCGTPSHVTEPDFTGVSGRYIDLSAVYDCNALQPQYSQFASLNVQYKSEYAKAYRLLHAAHSIRACTDQPLQEKTIRELDILAQDAVEDHGQPGQIREIFLSAVTGSGYLPALPQAVLPVDVRIAVTSSCGLERAFMKRLASAATATGIDAVLCRSPRAPEDIEHVFFPGATAFISGPYASMQASLCTRVLDLDQAIGAGDAGPRQLRQLYLPLAQTVEDAACAHLRTAKRMHDDLETLYFPYVNFKLADQIFQQQLEQLASKTHERNI